MNCNCNSKIIIPFLAGVVFCVLFAGIGFLVWQNFIDNNPKDAVNIVQEDVKNGFQEEKIDLNLEILEEGAIEIEDVVQDVPEIVAQDESVIEAVQFPADNFQSDADGNFFGRLTLTGYPVIEQYPQAFCDPEVDDGCTDIFYVKFMISGDLNSELKKYADEQMGNSFIGDKWIGIGCQNTSDQTLSFFNASDEKDMIYFPLEEADSEKLFLASLEKPVTITVEKLLLTLGSGAPDCYSHFSSLKVW